MTAPDCVAAAEATRVAGKPTFTLAGAVTVIVGSVPEATL
jgi:hypothetical protein